MNVFFYLLFLTFTFSSNCGLRFFDQSDLYNPALTFDDILLVPMHSYVVPNDTCLKTKLTKEIEINIPIISAAMDTVTETELAIALAREGGVGIIHRSMSIEQQADQVRQVKKFEQGIIRDPVTIYPNATLQELLELKNRYAIAGVPVVEHGVLVGIVTNRDTVFEKDLSKKVCEVMTPRERLITAPEGISYQEAIELLHEYRIEKLPIVNEAFELRGMITVRDIQSRRQKPNACKDNRGRLRVGAAVGVGENQKERARALVAVDVDVLVVDSAHGHSQGILDMVKWIKTELPSVAVIAGNVATPQAALDLVAAGADAIKVGIGAGSICTTRIVTGVGMPQVTAIAVIAQALEDTGVPIIADGGIRFSGDVCKAIAVGASCVMMGSLFAGTDESPGVIELYQGRAYKAYRGMGSLAAMAKRYTLDRYFHETRKGVPEGVEARVAYKGHLAEIVDQLVGGLRSCMGYLGCETIELMHKNAMCIRITSAGMRESHVHDVMITKEAPNYSIQ